MPSADSAHLTALVPVKRLSAGKTRLLPVLSRQECRALVRAMLTDVLAALAQTPTVREIAILTSDEAALAGVAHYYGVRLLRDPGRGLDAALDQTAAFLASQGAGRLLLLPADVPLVTRMDLERLIGLLPGGQPAECATAVLVPSADRRGTNAALVAPCQSVGAFGFASTEEFRVHWRRALDRGVKLQAVLLPHLSFDIDTPDDLLRFLSGRSATASRAYLEGAGIAERLLTAAAGSVAGADRAPS